MSSPSVGLVIAIIDALDQYGGGSGIVDRFDEKAYRYIRDAPGRGSSSGFRWTPDKPGFRGSSYFSSIPIPSSSLSV